MYFQIMHDDFSRELYVGWKGLINLVGREETELLGARRILFNEKSTRFSTSFSCGFFRDDYLTDVLQRISSHPASQVTELTP